MLDFNKKYEYHILIHLRNNKKLSVLYFSDNPYVDEAFEEFIKDKSYVIVSIVKGKKLIPGYLNVFDIQYIELQA